MAPVMDCRSEKKERTRAVKASRVETKDQPLNEANETGARVQNKGIEYWK